MLVGKFFRSKPQIIAEEMDDSRQKAPFPHSGYSNPQLPKTPSYFIQNVIKRK